VLIDEQLYGIEGFAYTGLDIAFKAPESNLFTQPSDYTEVALIISVPIVTNNFIPFLKSTHILAKLIIFGPLFNNLQSIK
jgi:hypothetical protein